MSLRAPISLVALAVVLVAGCLPPVSPPAETRRITTHTEKRPGPAPYNPPPPPAEVPSISARITSVSPQWKEGQQRFTLVLKNNGRQKEKVHAIVYGKNESISPPRRGLSPPTASKIWFDLARSQDGKITSLDLERVWRSDAFLTARSGKLARTWEAVVEPGDKAEIEGAHDLDELSPFPASKGKKLDGKAGFTDYAVWLFTPDGYCFSEQTFKVEGKTTVATSAPPPPPPPPPTTRPDTKSETTPATGPEAQAASALKLANYYLDQNKPEQAKERLEAIVSKFPDTDAAKTARQMLKTLK